MYVVQLKNNTKTGYIYIYHYLQLRTSQQLTIFVGTEDAKKQGKCTCDTCGAKYYKK